MRQRIWFRTRNELIARRYQQLDIGIVSPETLHQRSEFRVIVRTRRELLQRGRNHSYPTAASAFIQRNSSCTTRGSTTMEMYLFFVCPPDNADGTESEPLLGSAGKTPDDCWPMLRNNRLRELGDETSSEDLKTRFSALGYLIHRYKIEPLNPVTTPAPTFVGDDIEEEEEEETEEYEEEEDDDA